MKIAVIMSTYNGQRYLKEQIDSILEQTGVEVELFVRDDGSVDDTRRILNEYNNKYSNVHVHEGENVGFRRSFMMELRSAMGFDCYAFSDQDDYWEKEKLLNGCKMLQKQQKNNAIPMVYYSNLKVSDEKLNVYRKTDLEKRKKSLESLVMRRSIAGCTMIFNAAMWKCINKVSVTPEMLCRGHDSFILSLCYAVGGTVICDSNAYIRYRQHSTNTSGSSNGLFQRMKKEWNALTNKRGTEPAIANSILLNWGDQISEENKNSLKLVVDSNLDIGSRMKIFFSPKFTTGDLRLTTLGKFRTILGLL